MFQALRVRLALCWIRQVAQCFFMVCARRQAVAFFWLVAKV